MKDGKQQRTQTRNVGPLSFRAALVPSSVNEENRTVDIIWTSGAPVLRRDWDGNYYEELSLDPKHVRMERLESGNTPLLDSHRRYDNSTVIGVVESARIEKGQGVATVRFAKDDEVAESIWRKVKDGICRNISVGYRTYAIEKTEEVGKLPIHRAIDWEPYEISVVPVGADTEATVREADATNPCEFIELVEETRNMKTKTPAPETSSTPAAAAAVPQDSAVDEAAIRAEGAKAERERQAAIQRTASALDLGDFAQRHLEGTTSAEEFQRAAFDEFEKRKAPIVPDTARPEILPGEDRRDKWLRGAGDWLIQRAALSSRIISAGKKRGETITIDPGEFRGMSLIDLAKESLENAGVKVRGMDPMKMVGLAMTHRSGMQTSSDFGVLLENVMHKTLLAAYELEDDTWRRFCHIGSVSDFRSHNRYRRGSFGTLDTVAEHGEFKNKTIADGRKESITASTKGNLVVISRQAIINDDMGAFNSLAIEIGQMAGLSIEEDAYALLALNAGLGPLMADGVALFNAAHGNIGSSAALSTAALDADDALMAAQRDENDKRFLSIKPKVLLIPRGLKMTAQLLNTSEYEVDTAARKSQVPNTVRGLFDDIVATPYLTGNRRYMFADPDRTPTIEVAFLNGQDAPYLEMKEGWSVDGVEWKVRLDYAVGGVDYKGALTNAGG